jgi:hypothetical protein
MGAVALEAVGGRTYVVGGLGQLLESSSPLRGGSLRRSRVVSGGG